MKIVVLLGGNSPEREVSLNSGKMISRQLAESGHEVIEIDPADYAYQHDMLIELHQINPETVFIGLHGGDGENGRIQAILDAEKIRYTGSGFKASAMAMDKLVSKLIARESGIPVPRYFVMNKKSMGAFGNLYQMVLQAIFANAEGGKLVVKPVDAGSSVGVNIVCSEKEFISAVHDALEFSNLAIAEEYIEGRELTVTILNGIPLPVVEIKPHQGWYNYFNKYKEGTTSYHVPADISSEEAAVIQEYALKIWQALDCAGYARIDFRSDGKDFFFLEVNTLPGMTSLSLTPMAAKAIGISFGELLEKIISSAVNI